MQIIIDLDNVKEILKGYIHDDSRMAVEFVDEIFDSISEEDIQKVKAESEKKVAVEMLHGVIDTLNEGIKLKGGE